MTFIDKIIVNTSICFGHLLYKHEMQALKINLKEANNKVGCRHVLPRFLQHKTVRCILM